MSTCCLHISIQDYERRFGRVTPQNPWGETLWDDVKVSPLNGFVESFDYIGFSYSPELVRCDGDDAGCGAGGEIKLAYGAGDCDLNSDCADGLVCGHRK